MLNRILKSILKSIIYNLKSSSQGGQMLVVTLLIMVVGLTTGLMLMNRTTTDISLTSKVTDSSRAFNAAEAGVEEAIKTGSSVIIGSPVPFASSLNYTLTEDTLGAGNSIYPATKPTLTKVGDIFNVWLVNHNDTVNPPTLDLTTSVYTNNNIDICFTGDTDISNAPAIGVTVYYLHSGSMQSTYMVYDPNGGRKTSDMVQADTTLTNCSGYNYHTTIDFSGLGIVPADTLVSLRLQPFYAESSIAVFPYQALPKQGNQITSTGTAAESQRTIQVNNQYKAPAPFLDDALYVVGDITKN